MFKLTGAILKKIAPTLPEDRAEKIAELLNTVCPTYGIDSADILHEFLANVIHESGEFMTREENLNYSAPRLMIVWPSRFNSLTEAQKYAHNPAKLAGFVYGKRKSLGNITEADGWLFRGSGFIQMTGRINFVMFASYARQKFNIVKPLETWADLIRNSDEWAIHSACYIYAISMDLIPASLANNMKYIVKRINGGYIGIDSRLKYYEKCKKYISL